MSWRATNAISRLRLLVLIAGVFLIGMSAWQEIVGRDVARSDHTAISACLLLVGYLFLRESGK